MSIRARAPIVVTVFVVGAVAAGCSVGSGSDGGSVGVGVPVVPSFPPPPPLVPGDVVPAAGQLGEIYRVAFDPAAAQVDRVAALEGSEEQNLRLLMSGERVPPVLFTGVGVLDAVHVVGSGTVVSSGRAFTVPFVVADGRWKVQRDWACALTKAC